MSRPLLILSDDLKLRDSQLVRCSVTHLNTGLNGDDKSGLTRLTMMHFKLICRRTGTSRESCNFAANLVIWPVKRELYKKASCHSPNLPKAIRYPFTMNASEKGAKVTFANY